MTETEAETETATQWLPSGPETRRRMLIVDDEAAIRECLADYFGAHGFAVETVFSGEEALLRIEVSPPDVVLLDILLPGLSGLEVLKRVRQHYPQVRVVMVSCLDQLELRTAAQRHGAAGYVLKPFDFSDRTWAAVS